MPTLGVPELVVILVIVIVVFGAGRLGEIGGALGKGIKEFRSATKDESEDKKPVEEKKLADEKKPTEEAKS
jgi:sec-independent protein translocase protein TatA